MESIESDKQRLGQSDLYVSSVGLGAWAWGDRFIWGYGGNYSFDDVTDAYNAYVNAGGNFIDTAEVYGQGQSERIVGELLKSTRSNIILASKFMPYPWRIRGKDLSRALTSSLKRLGLDQLDLYQIHIPLPPKSIETWCNELASNVKNRKTNSIGMSNFNTTQLQTAYSTLIKHGIFLASNQVEYHLLNRKIENNGVFSQCKELGISIIAYSPLAQGLLTGKYTPENPPKGVRGFRTPQKLLQQIQPLIRLMLEIGREHEGKTPAQVALNWVICKGAIPIPGAKNGSQSLQNIGAMGWRLSSNEVEALDKVSSEINQNR